MTDCRPNFYKASHEIDAAKAYIYLKESGKVYTGFTYENTTPSRVFHDLDMRWRIDTRLTQAEIDKLMKILKPLFKKLHEKTEVVWKNGNEVREFFGHEDLCNDIEHICNEFVSDDFEQCGDEECFFCYKQNEEGKI